MEQVKKPSAFSAILVTIAALLDLYAIFISIADPHPSMPFKTFAVCEIILIACSMIVWAKYLKAYIRFAVYQYSADQNDNPKF